MPGLRPEALTWTALLAKWVEFARGALALPEDADGDRWRAAVPPIIELQAVTFALGDLAVVEPKERPFARDRAEVMIADAARGLEATWAGTPMPPMLLETLRDARRALAASIYVGAVEMVWNGGDEGDEVREMPEVPLDLERAAGTLAIMAPGTLVMPGEPVAWWIERDGAAIEAALEGCAREAPDVPHQVYRMLDESGRLVRDLVRPITADPEPGLPLLVPLVEEGRAIGAFPLDAETWLERQAAALPPSGMLPVDWPT